MRPPTLADSRVPNIWHPRTLLLKLVEVADEERVMHLSPGTRRATAAVLLAVVIQVIASPVASAYEFKRTLREGSSGRDVRALQIRIAGWFPAADQSLFDIDGLFDADTKVALQRFQAHYGLAVDGIAGDATFAALNALQERDGTTVNFDWSEFWQNSNSSCSATANSYAGTFEGGPIEARKIKKNVRRLMWRLEALRAKLGGQAIGINSGYRSIAYNQCIGGASASQHMYGTAVDMKVVGTTNRLTRDVGKATQLHGIACYSSKTHNHLDLRLQNEALPSAQFWYWPDRDAYGRDLADDNQPCWGETITTSPRTSKSSAGDSTEPTWTESEVQAWEKAGEPDDMGRGD